MHSSRLAELASWVAVNSGSLVYGSQDQPILVASSYWMTSKRRIQHWITSLKMFEKDIQQPDPKHEPWAALEIVVQEILQTEMLTRVWSATVLCHDWYRRSDELSGLAHSVYLSHLEVKNRALRIMLAADGQGQGEREAVERLNALRRRTERWTDVFLGQLPFGDIAAQFAFDRKRVADYQLEQCESIDDQNQTRRKVLQASFATDLIRNQSAYSANPELNRQIAGGVLACFPSDRFDSIGLPKSIRMLWLEKAHHDTQMLVDQLIGFEAEFESGYSLN